MARVLQPPTEPQLPRKTTAQQPSVTNLMAGYNYEAHFNNENPLSFA